MSIKKLFEDNFSGDVNAYQEYHALIVEHGKNCYLKKMCIRDRNNIDIKDLKVSAMKVPSMNDALKSNQIDGMLTLSLIHISIIFKYKFTGFAIN